MPYYFCRIKVTVMFKTHPYFSSISLPFILDTDSSQCGIGAVLSQQQNGEEKVIAYACRTLTKAERKYLVTRKELLAVIRYIQHFKQFLLGRLLFFGVSSGFKHSKSLRDSWRDGWRDFKTTTLKSSIEKAATTKMPMPYHIIRLSNAKL